MIHRGNWKLIKKYLEYRAEVDQISEKSLRLEETWLRHVLEWADSRSFDNVVRFRPTLPEYMLTARLDGEVGQLSPIYMRKVIGSGRRFFEWLTKHQAGYRHKIGLGWLDTLKLGRIQNDVKEHEAVTIDEVRAIAAAPVETLRDRRIRAAAVFWFLSGIRVGAFVSLPLSAVDIRARSIKQWPNLGVHTKFSKRATTYLLEIPDLLPVIEEWDFEIRSILPASSFWFAPISPESGKFDPAIFEVGSQRDTRARKDLKEWLERVKLPYHSPHKFRHGHAVYAIKQSKDIHDLKAVSQNLMHSNLSTTDGVYGGLSDNDVGERIVNLGAKAKRGEITQDELLRRLEAISADIAELKRNPR